MVHDYFKMKNKLLNVSRLTFEELNDLANHIKKAPTSEIFKNENLSSEKEKDKRI